MHGRLRRHLTRLGNKSSKGGGQRISQSEDRASARRGTPPLQRSTQGQPDAVVGIEHSPHVKPRPPGNVFRSLPGLRRTDRKNRSRNRRGSAKPGAGVLQNRISRRNRAGQSERPEDLTRSTRLLRRMTTQLSFDPAGSSVLRLG